MERTTEHQKLDISLRLEFINQVSLDEFISSNYPEIEDLNERLKLAASVSAADPSMGTMEEIEEIILERVVTHWAQTLLQGTTLNEILYLRGHTDFSKRATLVKQWNQEHQGTGKEVPEIDS